MPRQIRQTRQRMEVQFRIKRIRRTFRNCLARTPSSRLLRFQAFPFSRCQRGTRPITPPMLALSTISRRSNSTRMLSLSCWAPTTAALRSAPARPGLKYTGVSLQINMDRLLAVSGDCRHILKVFLATCPTVFGVNQYAISPAIVNNIVVLDVVGIGKAMHAPIIDVHRATAPYSADFGDKVHPNPHGAMIIAQAVYSFLKSKALTAHLSLPTPVMPQSTTTNDKPN